MAAKKKLTTKRRPRSVGIEGTWIAVPIDGGRFVPAMTARVNRSILLLYLFAEVFPSVPRLDEVVGLAPSHAARIHQAGDLGLLEQTWAVIGAQPGWDRTQWPVPPAIRRDPLSNCAWKVQYDDDLSNYVETRIAYDADLPADGLYGYGAVEILMGMLANGETPGA